MQERQELQEEFIMLRNAKVHRPKEHEGARAHNLYYDYLNETETLSQIRSDAELQASINMMKQEYK